MKRFFAIFLAFAMILALAACGETASPAAEGTPSSTPAPAAEATPEPTPPPTVETWYGQSHGVELTLALSSDGTYTLTLGQETRSGSWTRKDGAIILDGDEAAPLYRVDGKLSWQGTGLYLYAEKPTVSAYVPAEVLTDGVTAAGFGGYWTSLFVDVGGVILPASELGDRTDLYVDAAVPEAEGADTVRVALGGPLFGDVAVDMQLEGGALLCADGEVSVKLERQADDLLRMTLSAPNVNTVLYLASGYVEGLSPEPTAG